MSSSPISTGSGTDLRAIAQAVREARSARPAVPLAIATLVCVEGSSYRQPGARLLVDADGRVLAGAISGGCLEGDVAVRAAEVCATLQPCRLRYDLREDLETIWGFGVGCDGIAHVLLEPFADDGWLFDALARCDARRGDALVTVAGSAHPTYPVGSHYAIDRQSANADAFADAVRSVIATANHTLQPQFESVAIDGHQVAVLAEPLLAPIALHIVGAGRGAEAFASIAHTLGWQVTVIDHRPTLLDSLHLPDGVRRLKRRAEEGVSDLVTDARTAVALLTHIFDVDSAWMATVLPTATAYIGVLGSRDRAGRLLERLESLGTTVSRKMRRRLFAPIGLDLGGESPESIALAAIAEIEAVLHGRPGGPLRERRSPIHARTPTPASLRYAGDPADPAVASCVLPRDGHP